MLKYTLQLPTSEHKFCNAINVRNYIRRRIFNLKPNMSKKIKKLFFLLKQKLA